MDGRDSMIDLACAHQHHDSLGGRGFSPDVRGSSRIGLQPLKFPASSALDPSPVGYNAAGAA